MRADLLHVVAVYSNPRRFASRLRLLQEFIPNMLETGVNLTIVTHAFGERPFDLDRDDPALRHVNLIEVRGGADQELWIKEALINIGVRHLPDDWRYLAWVDADIRFVNDKGAANWAAETVHMLQHNIVGQPWSHSVDLGPKGEVMTNEWGKDADRSFAAAFRAGDIVIQADSYGSKPLSKAMTTLGKNPEAKPDRRQHYGYAWAIRRDGWNGIGGLPDWFITGSADYHTSMAFAGRRIKSAAYTSPGAVRRLNELYDRCDRVIRQDVGVVPGTVLHGFHGNKKLRYYLDRKDILIESGYDPDRDLTHDWQGIPSLTGDNRLLRDGLRRLFTLRNEDDIRIDD